MTPEPHEVLAVLGLGLDRDARARQPTAVEPLVQLVGKRLGHERGVIDPLGRRIELGGDDEVEGHRPLVEQPPLASAREPMGQRAERTEAGGDIGRRQRGELTERAHAEPGEQIDELVEARARARRGGTPVSGWERGTPRSLRKPRRALCFTAQRRELGGERRVGDADDRRAGDVGSAAERLGCKCNDPLGRARRSPPK